MYYIKFKVSGRGSFPFDMLRYDACHPRTSGDASQLSVDEDRRRETRTVELAKISRSSYALPTSGRWSSFGWSVDPDSIVAEKVS